MNGRMNGTIFALARLRADFSNFFLLHYSACDAFLITGKNSGTHWLRYMLSCAIAAQFGVAPPERPNGKEGNAIIGHPRHPRRYAQLPRLGSSHNLPSRAFVLPGLRHLLPSRPVVILTRDIPEAMLSHYVKYRNEYAISLADYIEGDPWGRRHVADVWWFVHFFNIWGEYARTHPDRTLAVKYEDLRADPARWLDLAAARLGVKLSPAALDAGLVHVGRDAIRSRLEAGAQVVVPDEASRAAIAYAPEEMARLRAILRRHLRHDFGYGYLPG